MPHYLYSLEIRIRSNHVQLTIIRITVLVSVFFSFHITNTLTFFVGPVVSYRFVIGIAYKTNIKYEHK